MLNVFYNPVYFISNQKKLFITKQFKYSKLFNFYILALYRFNLPYFENTIFSGPQMRVNHLIRAFRENKNITFNSIKSSNFYILQFDDYGEKILKKIINAKIPNTKILVGPLYSIDMDKKLTSYMKKYNFIRKMVASDSALEYQKLIHGNDISRNIFVCPSGIKSSKDLIIDKKYSKEFDCLIYFKKRDYKDLDFITNFLKSKKLSYNILNYGSYKNSELEYLSQKSKFGIIINKTESQGFAIQKMMSTNLPLIVWDYKINNYEGYKLPGTSVPFWDNMCGIKIGSINEFEKKFDNFIHQLDTYSPINFIKNNLTYEQFVQNIFEYFSNKNNWSN